jgi:hypothetical protein
MPGLLDFLGLDQQPQQGGLLNQEQQGPDWRAILQRAGDFGQGLLQASGPSMSPVAPSLGQMLGAGAQSMQAGDQNRQAGAMRDMQAKSMGQQFEQNAMQMQEAKDKKAIQQRIAQKFGPSSMMVANSSGQMAPQPFDMASISKDPAIFGDLVSIYGLPAVMEMAKKQRDILKLGPNEKAFDATTGATVAENAPLLKEPKYEKFDEGDKVVTYRIHSDGTRTKVAEGPRFAPQRGDPAEGFNKVSTLRKEFQARPEVQSWQVVQPIIASIEQAARRDTRAADLNLVYGLSKIMDPNSVVREGEMIMVKDTASIPLWLKGEAERLNGGGALRPETRQAILAEARSRAQHTYGQAKSIADQYTGFASRNGLPPEDVVFGLSPYAPGGESKANKPTPQKQNLPAPPPGFTVLP